MAYGRSLFYGLAPGLAPIVKSENARRHLEPFDYARGKTQGRLNNAESLKRRTTPNSTNRSAAVASPGGLSMTLGNF
jgi:hypothetical protein